MLGVKSYGNYFDERCKNLERNIASIEMSLLHHLFHLPTWLKVWCFFLESWTTRLGCNAVMIEAAMCEVAWSCFAVGETVFRDIVNTSKGLLESSIHVKSVYPKEIAGRLFSGVGSLLSLVTCVGSSNFHKTIVEILMTPATKAGVACRHTVWSLFQWCHSRVTAEKHYRRRQQHSRHLLFVVFARCFWLTFFLYCSISQGVIMNH